MRVAWNKSFLMRVMKYESNMKQVILNESDEV